MKFPNWKSVCLLALLSLGLLATRVGHFGSSINPPDVTLAVMFLAGWYLASWHSLAVLLLCAGLADALSIAGGISAWCVTPAYWFLIPAYAAPWLAGRLSQAAAPPLARRTAIALLALVAAIVVFFAISNASFYLLSGYFGSMDVVTYTSAVVGYLPRYLAPTLGYVAIVAVSVFIGRFILARTRLPPAREIT